MKGKLTLSIESNVILKARQLSKRRRKSVSVLFEEFVHQQERMKPNASEKSVVDRLTGVLQDDGLSYNEMKKKYRTDKMKKGKHA